MSDATDNRFYREKQEQPSSNSMATLTKLRERFDRGLGFTRSHIESVFNNARVEIERLSQDLARTESARVAILAENAHYKRRVAELESIIRGKTFVTPEPPAAQPSNDRSAFEHWLHDVHGLESVWQEERNCYKDFPAHLAYSAWCASRERLPPPATQEEPTPRYQCFVAGCPANHASKRDVCDTRPSEAIAVWLDAEGNFQWDFEINEDHPIDAAVVIAKRTNWVMTDEGWRLALTKKGDLNA